MKVEENTNVFMLILLLDVDIVVKGINDIDVNVIINSMEFNFTCFTPYVLDQLHYDFPFTRLKHDFSSIMLGNGK